jgi:o-succinylbenzoate synthase
MAPRLVELRRLDAALGRRVRSAVARWPRRAAIWPVIRDEDGLVGVGEAAPLPGYGPDDLDEVAAELTPWLGRALPSELEALPDWLGEFRSPSARFAVETALLELFARRVGRPPAALLRALVPAAARSERKDLGLAALIDDEPGPAEDEAIEAALAAGARAIKKKLRGPDELGSLARLAGILPPGVPLRLDANGGLDPDTAARLGRALPDRVALLEEPVAAGDWLRLAPFPTPLGLDESLRSPLARRLLDLPRVGAVVLKPSVLGGALAAAAWAAEARSRGLDVIVTHCFEGEVGHAACAVLHEVVGTAAAGLWPHPGLRALPRPRVDGEPSS